MTVADYGYSRLDEEANRQPRSPRNIAHILATIASHPSLLFKPLELLVPSYIQPLFWSHHGKVHGHERKIRKTAFLDGMRGWASLIVCFYHILCQGDWFWRDPYVPSGLPEGSDPNRFTMYMSLPYIRVIYSGKAMVMLFFVISGYVLSFRQVNMIRNQQWDKLNDSLFSSIFRRAFRLFMPCLFGLAVMTAMAHLDWRDVEVDARAESKGFLSDYWKESMFLLESYRFLGGRGHLHQLWTIPVEYWTSLVVFTTVLGLSRCRTTVRISLLILILAHFVMDGFWASGTFIGGILIAEMEAVLDDVNYKIPEQPTARLIYGLFWYSNLMFGLLLFGWPERSIELDPILKHFLPWTPQIYLDEDEAYRFWHCIAAIQVTWCAFRLPLMQKVFTTPLSLYLGDVSYSIYIVHMHWVLSVGRKMHRFTDSLYGLNRGEAGELNLIIANLMELGVLMTLIFWEGDLFWRYIDTPCVTFAKWVESKARPQQMTGSDRIEMRGLGD